MTSYDSNIVRYMKEDYLKYSEHLKMAKEKGNTKVVVFLTKLLKNIEENIKSFEE